MHFGERRLLVLLALLIVGTIGCATAASQPTTGQSRAQWWKANRAQAEFVPGKGYTVPGVSGFYDENGRPMDGESAPPGVNQVEPAEAEDEKESSGSWAENLDPARQIRKLSQSWKNATTAPPNTSESQRLYGEGETLFRKKEFAAAAKMYAEAAKVATESAVEADAMFMQGECHFFADAYPKANDAYNALVKKHPSTRHLDKVVTRQFAIARYWQQHHGIEPHWPITPNAFDKTRHTFDTRGHAIKTFDNIRLNDPTGPLADDALMATGNTYFLAGRFADADYHYGLVRKDYADSEHQYDAHLFGLQCQLRQYQGPDYDGKPLEDADKLAKQLLTQFPERINPDRERIEKMRQEIAAARAQRDWNLGNYHSRRQDYRAARYYYEQLVEEYPQTQLAQQARERLATIQVEPDVPPQKLPWLVNLFPESKRTATIALEPPSETIRR